MASSTIDQLIINSPYEEPAEHWSYDPATQQFSRQKERRPAGYLIASGGKAFNDPGLFVEIPLVNLIRPRVKAWREKGYPGTTGMTRRLLEYWQDEEEFASRRFFFCQLEAAETLIWLTEAPAADKIGLDIPSDGGAFRRLCAKMATGSGKTIVMAMVAAWHMLNKVASPRDTRFSKHILVLAPGLTVKNRLAVLDPQHPSNYYESFRVVPSALLNKLRQGKVLIRNWHALGWQSAEKIAAKRGVDKRGALSDAAYVRDVLGDMASARDLLIINDEAHHAWRVPAAAARTRGIARAEIEEATKWVGGLDRIHRARGIRVCYDFSATPFAPSGRQSVREALFGWIVSDFGLNDAIESGLVKTPRVVVRDDALPDAKTYKPRLYHIYSHPDVRADLNSDAGPEEPLPDLVLNGYHLLGYDWRETLRVWEASPTPPVMITVANSTNTAARIKYAFDHRQIQIDELCDSEKSLHIDSKVLGDAEEAEEPIAQIDTDTDQGAGAGSEAEAPGTTYRRRLTLKQRAELLRRQVDTVGKHGKEGAHIQNVISVGMLSEGWDAQTVTHIMGLRAFTSQLLCEQVVGRGLRRCSYDINEETGLFEPEYVNVFGVPFTFLPHEGGEGPPPPPPGHKTAIEPVAEKAAFEISWPNVIGIERVLSPHLKLDWSTVLPLEIDAGQITELVELAPVIDERPDIARITEINLMELAEEFRMQRVIFETARRLYEEMQQQDWKGSKVLLMAQLVRLAEEFIRQGRIRVIPEAYGRDELRLRLAITLSMTKVIRHIRSAIRFGNTERIDIVLDQDQPICSTGDMRTWYTGRPCGLAKRSHINYCVYDSTWEASDAFALDRAEEVAAWVKNDHLNFEVPYIHDGIVRKYRPDFLVRLTSGDMLVLETKGVEQTQDKVKQQFLREWARAVNEHGGFGYWYCAMSKRPGEIEGILGRVLAESKSRQAGAREPPEDGEAGEAPGSM